MKRPWLKICCVLLVISFLAITLADGKKSKKDDTKSDESKDKDKRQDVNPKLKPGQHKRKGDKKGKDDGQGVPVITEDKHQIIIVDERLDPPDVRDKLAKTGPAPPQGCPHRDDEIREIETDVTALWSRVKSLTQPVHIHVHGGRVSSPGRHGGEGHPHEDRSSKGIQLGVSGVGPGLFHDPRPRHGYDKHGDKSHGNYTRTHRHHDHSHRQDDRSHRPHDHSHRQHDRSHRSHDHSRRQHDRSHRPHDHSRRQHDRSHRHHYRGHRHHDHSFKFLDHTHTRHGHGNDSYETDGQRTHGHSHTSHNHTHTHGHRYHDYSHKSPNHTRTHSHRYHDRSHRGRYHKGHDHSRGHSSYGGYRSTHVHIHLSIDDKPDHSPHKEPVRNESLYARCDLRNSNSNSNLVGYILLRQKPGQNLEVKFNISGFVVPRLDLGQVEISEETFDLFQRGFHIHEYGDFSQGCLSFGAHYNPAGTSHGAMDHGVRHVGDWGNIEVNENGVAASNFSVSDASLAGPHSILGRGIVVHAQADDLGTADTPVSKASGSAGARLACCVIGNSKPVENW